MKRYTLDENRGDIIYEVDGDMLILRISPHFVSSISHDNYYMIKTGDDTVASDYNVFSAKRTLEEIGRSGKQYWKIVEKDGTKYLTTTDYYDVVSEGDVVAYSKGDHDIVLPMASEEALGAIRIGEGLAIGDDGVVTVTSTGSIGGVNVTGEGNVISSVSLSGDRKTITFLRGVTAITTDNYADTLDKRYLKLDGNASSATKLQTSRTLWGQSFNGTEDVSGDMIDVGSITASGLIKTASDVVAYASGNYDIVLPIASSSALGAVKVGDGLSISSDGTISVTDIGTVGSIKTNGEGNVISSVTLSGDRRTITFTRGITALTPDNYSNTLDSAYLQLSGGTISGVLYSTVTGKAPISVKSSVVCESLNADLLDGTHKGGLFTGLSNVNSEISITIGGTSKQLVVGYSSNCGNAATATQLKTSRTLWGQSFNGTKNVSGDMTSVGSITASGAIKTTSDIVAYASSDAPSPFKYWYPSVDVTGKLTWKNDTSTTEPSPVNIKGPRGYSIKSISVKSESKVSEGASVYNVYAESSTTNPIGTFTVYNGERGERGYKINKITQTASSSESEGTNTYAMYNEDGTLAGSFSVKNGKRGATGDASSVITTMQKGTDRTIVRPQTYPAGKNLGAFGGRPADAWQYFFISSLSEAAIGWIKEDGSSNLTVFKANRSGSTINCTATNGAFIDGSDARRKKIISKCNITINDIISINNYHFRWTDEDDSAPIKCGVLAQDLLGNEELKPFVTTTSDENGSEFYGVNYGGLGVAIAVGGVKELYTLVRSLQNRIEELESVISTLKKSDTL